jgi:hypothetical protein
MPVRWSFDPHFMAPPPPTHHATATTTVPYIAPTAENWKCLRYKGDIHDTLQEFCDKIERAHVRHDRGKWCGCDDDA